MGKLITSFYKTVVNFVENSGRMYNRNSIEYWQVVIFRTIFMMMLSVGVAIYIPSVIYALSCKDYGLAVLYTFTIGTLLFIFFFKPIPLKIRTILISIVLFFLGTMLEFSHGPGGTGNYFLMITVLITALFIGIRVSMIASFITLFIIMSIEVLHYHQVISWKYLDISDYPYTHWAITNLNIFFICVIFSISISMLIWGVKKTFVTINKTKEATITGLAKLAEFRDTDTGLHLERIREYAALIARTLSKHEKYKGYITYQYIDDILLSSTLHDIGKVGIPDNILLKPGKLDQDEFDIMKAHSEIGKNVIEEITNKLGDKSFLDMAQCIAHYHHEKWDGTGYPCGLKGEEIPFSARIIALVDVYDALTSRRVYKEAMPHEKAVTIITSEKGRHFDPLVTEVFIQLESHFNEIRNKYDIAEFGKRSNN